MLYVGLPLKMVRILQLVQNRAARLLMGTGHYVHMTPVLRWLHWLPIEVQAQFKVLVMTYKALNGLGPGYLKERLRPYVPARPLRSAGEALLREPSVKDIRRITDKMSKTPSTNYSVNQPHTSETEQSLSAHPFNVTEPVTAKRICFYKSGDSQFNGVKMVVSSRSFKSFDALLDNLSKKVPLPFGVRNITTPRGIHSINNLEDLEDGKSYICSQQKKIKPIDLEMASRKPLPWQISRPLSARRRAVQLARGSEGSVFQRGSTQRLSNPKKLLVFRNGNVRIRHAIVLTKKNTQNFEALLDHISELMQYPVLKLHTTDGRKTTGEATVKSERRDWICSVVPENEYYHAGPDNTTVPQ
ncbi:Oxygen-regulated protein 1 [Varanus komodoensis]|nr:Oxygen-regulated protein 1 [Varanus komodoensis]